ncbi:MAG TPA: hypothetical protein VHT95_03175 [Vicinamibacterales bacterium]|nr:hypothetical protein [Vicinamibacterales bacterium]
MNSPTSEQELVAALKRMARETDVPAPDSRVEQALLAAFDVAWQQRRRTPGRSRPFWRAGAALLALAATIAWMIGRTPGRVPPQPSTGDVATETSAEASTLLPAPAVRPEAPALVKSAIQPHRARARAPRIASRNAVEFVAWPGATGLPAFESGYLMRVDMPASIVLSLGLVPHAPQAAFVQADVLVGQDKLPRAVRLVP